MITKRGGKKKRRENGITQQVDRIIFGENMKLLKEVLKGEFVKWGVICNAFSL